MERVLSYVNCYYEVQVGFFATTCLRSNGSRLHTPWSYKYFNGSKEIWKNYRWSDTDSAAASYKNYLTYFRRAKIYYFIDRWVSEVVPQDQLDYVKAIQKYKPKYFVHGTDWQSGVQKNARERVIEAMNEIGGTVIEPEYTSEFVLK